MRFLILILLGAAAAAGDVEQLGWMSGCWAGQSGPLLFEEQWSKPLGGVMLGAGRTSKQGRVVETEFLEIAEKDGAVVYLPRINGKAAVVFKATKVTTDEVVFENPEHDFPQRVIYRKAPGGLHARIDGKVQGKERAQEFPMKAVDCK